jgi:hypothetical protein
VGRAVQQRRGRQQGGVEKTACLSFATCQLQNKANLDKEVYGRQVHAWLSACRSCGTWPIESNLHLNNRCSVIRTHESTETAHAEGRCSMNQHSRMEGSAHLNMCCIVTITHSPTAVCAAPQSCRPGCGWRLQTRCSQAQQSCRQTRTRG